MMKSIELTETEIALFETMPSAIAHSVMISLAINLIRAVRGQYKGSDLPDNPIRLIAEIAAIITLEKINSIETSEAVAAEAISKARGH